MTIHRALRKEHDPSHSSIIVPSALTDMTKTDRGLMTSGTVISRQTESAVEAEAS